MRQSIHRGRPRLRAQSATKVSSVDRVRMYTIEKWPLNMERDWLRKMREARLAAIEVGLDLNLIKTAALLGIVKLVRSADEFQAAVFDNIRRWVSAHEVSISEVMKELQYRITKVAVDFDLTEEQVTCATTSGLVAYVNDGGSLEFAVGLADFMDIPEEKRRFLHLAADLSVR
jgi:hypothetical protein